MRVRAVTDEEVGFFFENGWVKLPELIAPDAAAAMLERVKRLMGPGGDANRLRDRFDFDTAPAAQPYRRPSDDDDLLRAFATAPEMGRNAARLMGRDSAVRLFDDCMLVKLPVSRRPDRGQALEWHQDTQPLDRYWALFWIALDEVTPDQGPVRYFSGSQKLGPLWRGGWCVPLEQAYELAPRLRQCPLTEPGAFRPGDAAAHISGVVHGTPANVSDRVRWAYRLTYFAADALYTGVPSPTIQGHGTAPFEPLDHPDFPVVYRPGA